MNGMVLPPASPLVIKVMATAANQRAEGAAVDDRLQKELINFHLHSINRPGRLQERRLFGVEFGV